MLQSISSVFVVYRCKTLTGSPDPTHANGMNKPCNILNRYKELCKLYATAYHELTICARNSMTERIKACSLLEPYISDVLEQVDAALAIFCMENELRRLKGLELFKIPVLTPSAHTLESIIQLEAYCQAVDNEVKTIFEETFKPERTRDIEEQKRKKQPLLLTTTTQEITRSHQPYDKPHITMKHPYKRASYQRSQQTQQPHLAKKYKHCPNHHQHHPQNDSPIQLH